MGIDGLGNLSDYIAETPIPKEDQICKCDHSLAKHVPYNSGKNLTCTAIGCHCSTFRLNHIK